MKKAIWQIGWYISITLLMPIILIVFTIIHFTTDQGVYELKPWYLEMKDVVLWCYQFTYDINN